MEKDYSLLRPFDLESAKRWEKICFHDGAGLRTFVAGPDSIGDFVLQCEKGEFHLCSNKLDGWKMAPLAWVEGKPVYRDSVMFRKDNGWTCRYCHIGKSFQDEVGNWMDEAGFDLTWQKPKTKREGWVNVGGEPTSTCHSVWGSHPFSSKKLADEFANKNRVACIHITWEE